MPAVDSVFSIVIFNISMSLFDSTLLSFCKPQSKLDLPTLRQGSREITMLKIESTVDNHRKNAVNKNMSIKIPHEGKRSA